MPISQRQFIRFSLEVPAIMFRTGGERSRVLIEQISVGGCLVDADDGFYPGDEFRMELEMPNKNRLPLTCKVVYRFDNDAIGAKFVDITKFEQDLVAKTISALLELDGLPLPVDAFEAPPKFDEAEVMLKVSTPRELHEENLEKVMVLDLDA
ncbi:MAG: PilZ domain-containing protein [Candidatus Binatia bacterium]